MPTLTELKRTHQHCGAVYAESQHVYFHENAAGEAFDPSAYINWAVQVGLRVPFRRNDNEEPNNNVKASRQWMFNATHILDSEALINKLASLAQKLAADPNTPLSQREKLTRKELYFLRKIIMSSHRLEQQYREQVEKGEDVFLPAGYFSHDGGTYGKMLKNYRKGLAAFEQLIDITYRHFRDELVDIEVDNEYVINTRGLGSGFWDTLKRAMLWLLDAICQRVGARHIRTVFWNEESRLKQPKALYNSHITELEGPIPASRSRAVTRENGSHELDTYRLNQMFDHDFYRLRLDKLIKPEAKEKVYRVLLGDTYDTLSQEARDQAVNKRLHDAYWALQANSMGYEASQPGDSLSVHNFTSISKALVKNSLREMFGLPNKTKLKNPRSESAIREAFLTEPSEKLCSGYVLDNMVTHLSYLSHWIQGECLQAWLKDKGEGIHTMSPTERAEIENTLTIPLLDRDPTLYRPGRLQKDLQRMGLLERVEKPLTAKLRR